MAAPDPSPRCAPEEHCITCGDEGRAVRVIAVDADDGLALCEDELGERTTIQTELVGEVAEGETVLAHAGVALARLEGGGP